MSDPLPDALVGHTGFVGGNLARQRPFDALFHSRNIESIAGRAFGLLAVSAMPAAMWIANSDPEADLANLDRLLGCLRTVRADRVVVLSTVAVYPHPVAVNEDSPIEESSQTPYGRHRHQLERRLADQFPRLLCVRLPGLFGPGLKKNAIHDLIHDHETHKINASAFYQFYNLDRLWPDISKALSANLSIINFATEPTSIKEVARAAFGLDFTNDPGNPPARFDMRSRHAGLYNGRDGYLYDRRTILDELAHFVRQEREAIGRA
jgi:nucleoside-diphosphate-sugar epimerase